MKSFFVALIITPILIFSGIMFSKKIENISNDLYTQTSRIYYSIQNQETEKAFEYMDKTIKNFKKNKVLFEATSNHEEILRIEISFSHAAEFLKENQTGDTLACLEEIKILLKHLPGNFKLKPENIL